MYPRRPKAEALSNAVDVVVHLHDPSRSSTERTAPVATRPQMVCAAVHQCHPWISNADTHSTNGGFITE